MADTIDFYRKNLYRMYPLLPISSGADYTFYNNVVLPRSFLVDALFCINIDTGFNPQTDNVEITGLLKLTEEKISLQITGTGFTWIVEINKNEDRQHKSTYIDGSYLSLMLGDVSSFITTCPITDDWFSPLEKILFEPTCVIVEPPLVTDIIFYNDPRLQLVSLIPEIDIVEESTLVGTARPDKDGTIHIKAGVNMDLLILNDVVRASAYAGSGMGFTYQNREIYDYHWWNTHVFQTLPDCSGVWYFNGVSPDKDGKLNILGSAGVTTEYTNNKFILRISTNKQEVCTL